MRWLDSITDSTGMNLNKFREIGRQGASLLAQQVKNLPTMQETE